MMYLDEDGYPRPKPNPGPRQYESEIILWCGHCNCRTVVDDRLCPVCTEDVLRTQEEAYNCNIADLKMELEEIRLKKGFIDQDKLENEIQNLKSQLHHITISKESLTLANDELLIKLAGAERRCQEYTDENHNLRNILPQKENHIKDLMKINDELALELKTAKAFLESYRNGIPSNKENENLVI